MRTRLLTGLIPLLVLPTVGCGNEPPPTVSVVQPIEREVVEWDEYTGRLESPASVEVRARVSGYLAMVHFHE